MSIQQQQDIEALRREIETLKARLDALEGRIETRRPTITLPKKTNG